MSTATQIQGKVVPCRAGHLNYSDLFCPECAICTTCKRGITQTEYQWCLRQADEFESEPEFQHPGCFKELERIALSNEEIPIPRSLFNKLNACRLLIEPIEDWSVRTNEVDAEYRTQRWIHQMDLTTKEGSEACFIALRRMETISATLSLALSKSRRSISRGLEEKEMGKWQEVQEARKAPKTPKTATKKLIGLVASATKEDKLREKLVQNLIDLGMSEEAARESIKRKAPEVAQ